MAQGAGHKSGYGNNWVSLCLIVRLAFMRRAVGLTVLSGLWQPDPEAKRVKAAKRKPNPEYSSKQALAREMLDLVIARFPQRAIELVGDSAYATKAFRRRAVARERHLAAEVKRQARTSRFLCKRCLVG